MINELLASVVVSGLGAVLTVFGARAWRLARLWHLQRLCSIDGTFVTEFEHEDGSRRMSRAVTQLHQRGVTVRGVTTELATARTWQLEGEIDQSGFLRCTYSGADAKGGSARTLLLAIERGGDALSGLWASCDSQERQVSSGQYLMRRCLGATPGPVQTDRPAPALSAPISQRQK